MQLLHCALRSPISHLIGYDLFEVISKCPVNNDQTLNYMRTSNADVKFGVENHEPGTFGTNVLYFKDMKIYYVKYNVTSHDFRF